MSRLPITSIVIKPERHRAEMGNVTELAESISRLGLINPIVLAEGNVLVAGERRLRAMQSLGWETLAASQYRYTNKMQWHELEAIELEENIKRKDITWQEQCRAVQRYNKMRESVVGETWTIRMCAAELGIDYTYIAKLLNVAAEAELNPEIMKAAKSSVAIGMVARSKERRIAAALDNVLAEEPLAPSAPAAPKPAASTAPLINADFIEWSKTYTGVPFNFIHCDFPYGINIDKHNGQGTANKEFYDDSPEYYTKLITEGLPALPISQEAHLVFWFSMTHFALTKLTLQKMGWKVNDFPLIWAKSDNSGILPDPRRGPRRNYETAFLATRGDRPIVRAVSNMWHGPRGNIEHASTKPVEMLQHFFQMFIDDTSRVLDPTCGGGNALKIAQRMGAKHVLGIEMNKTYYEDAVRRWDSKESVVPDIDIVL